MSVRMFEGTEHACLYKRYRPTLSADVLKTLTDYVWEKTGTKPTLTVDVGCGSGQGTELLDSLSTKVLGIDVSPSQIEEAMRAKHPDNITYKVGPAETLPVEDGSVSLLTAFVSAHWFDLPAFMHEVERVLQPRGCLVIYSYMYPVDIECGVFSEKLTQILWKVTEDIRPYESHKMNHVREDYTAMYEAIPFADKKRLESIRIIGLVKLPELMGFIGSFAEYQALKAEDPLAAQALMEDTEKRVKETLGDAAGTAEMKIVVKTVLLLACNNSQSS
ncbi:putative methyltransferase DDB_G0268948 isoform X1 [Lethenteron reissneri]|uniref:putative methyltransferase DDB_G0268948 isoform X1 n=1 Tax=Lethenteron reissneri TaxID=7753 RepID=UPI002AB65A2C|nr:putative methyltransferase DDB_G0268948 isoform X1 [Lethenteron reissneri]